MRGLNSLNSSARTRAAGRQQLASPLTTSGLWPWKRNVVVSQLREQLGLEPVDYETVKRTVGGSVDVTMERLIGPELAPRAVEIFLPYFDKIMFEDLVALPGAKEILEALQTQGKRLAVFTNKRGDAARASTFALSLFLLLKPALVPRAAPRAARARKKIAGTRG